MLIRALIRVLVACVWLTAPIHAQASGQAASVPIRLPSGLVYDQAGNLYLAETVAHEVLMIAPSGVVSVYAGTGTQGYGGDGGAATGALLDSPMGLAINAAGDVYVADSHNHAVRKVSAATGVITTVAGTGKAGRGGDGGPATSALLNMPGAVAVDAGGNLYVADTRNHVVRKVTATTGVISTVAGNGVQGYSGDGGLATAAAIDTPAGLAVDEGGNLYLADAHNQRVRRVGGGVITTVAGTGVAGFAADGGQATGAALHLPGGITMDGSGNVYIADTANHRVRRVEAGTGLMTTVAGDGTEAFAGDAGAATTASLSSPRAVVVSPGALPTVADSGNQRVRQVDTGAAIHTIAGVGLAAQAGVLTLSAPATVTYGTGLVTATLGGTSVSGAVSFYDESGAVPVLLSTVALANNVATLSTASFGVGAHAVNASYAGDANHAGAQAAGIMVSVTPAAVVATPRPVGLLYGQAIPALSGTVMGVLPQDAASVSVAYASAAAAGLAPGTYPITAALSGSGAGNYSLTSVPAAVTIGRAPAMVTLNSAGSPVFAVHVSAGTAGSPTGVVALVDGASAVASGTLSALGDVTFRPVLSNGSHTLTATYGGDGNFLVGQSGPAIVAIGPVTTPDFTLTASGQNALGISAGSSGVFSFAVAPVNGALSSPIQLSASGLPPNATASFNPSYLPPGVGSTTFTLTLLTQKAEVRMVWPYVFALGVPLVLMVRRRRGLGVVLLVGLVGCGDRVNTAGSVGGVAAKSYTVMVMGTATGVGGVVLQHSAVVMLTVQ